jgi:hypothetical protein
MCSSRRQRRFDAVAFSRCNLRAWPVDTTARDLMIQLKALRNLRRFNEGGSLNRSLTSSLTSRVSAVRLVEQGPGGLATHNGPSSDAREILVEQHVTFAFCLQPCVWLSVEHQRGPGRARFERAHGTCAPGAPCPNDTSVANACAHVRFQIRGDELSMYICIISSPC